MTYQGERKTTESGERPALIIIFFTLYVLDVTIKYLSVCENACVCVVFVCVNV